MKAFDFNIGEYENRKSTLGTRAKYNLSKEPTITKRKISKNIPDTWSRKFLDKYSNSTPKVHLDMEKPQHDITTSQSMMANSFNKLHKEANLKTFDNFKFVPDINIYKRQPDNYYRFRLDKYNTLDKIYESNLLRENGNFDTLGSKINDLNNPSSSIPGAPPTSPNTTNAKNLMVAKINDRVSKASSPTITRSSSASNLNISDAFQADAKISSIPVEERKPEHKPQTAEQKANERIQREIEEDKRIQKQKEKEQEAMIQDDKLDVKLDVFDKMKYMTPYKHATEKTARNIINSMSPKEYDEFIESVYITPLKEDENEDLLKRLEEDLHEPSPKLTTAESLQKVRDAIYANKTDEQKEQEDKNRDTAVLKDNIKKISEQLKNLENETEPGKLKEHRELLRARGAMILELTGLDMHDLTSFKGLKDEIIIARNDTGNIPEHLFKKMNKLLKLDETQRKSGKFVKGNTTIAKLNEYIRDSKVEAHIKGLINDLTPKETIIRTLEPKTPAKQMSMTELREREQEQKEFDTMKSPTGK